MEFKSWAPPYQKKNALSKEKWAYLFDPHTSCEYCGTSDPEKKNENIGMVDWRDKTYRDDNTFPLCKLCYKTRRSRSKTAYWAFALKITSQMTKKGIHPDSVLLKPSTSVTKDIIHKEIRSFLEAPKKTSRGSTNNPDPNPAMTLKSQSPNTKKYYTYLQRQKKAKTEKCFDSRTGLPVIMSKDQFSQSLNGSDCFYCGAIPATTLDRIDSDGCYVDQNTLPACWECNTTKSNLPFTTFVSHMYHVSKFFLKK